MTNCILPPRVTHMPDTVVALAQEAIYGKLISIVLGAIISVIGALYGLYVWLFKRQITRIDNHDKFNVKITNSHDELSLAQSVTAMQLTVVKEAAEQADIRHKTDLEDHRLLTDRRVEAMEKAFDRQMLMLEKYLEKLVQQGERRRHTDN